MSETYLRSEPLSIRFMRYLPLGEQLLGEKPWRSPSTLMSLIELGLGGMGTRSGASHLLTNLPKSRPPVPPLTLDQRIEALRRAGRRAQVFYPGEGYEVSKAQWTRVQEALRRLRGE